MSTRKDFHRQKLTILARILGTGVSARLEDWTAFETPAKTLGYINGTTGVVIDSGVALVGDYELCAHPAPLATDAHAPEGWKRIKFLGEPHGYDKLDGRGDGALVPETYAEFLRPTIVAGAPDGKIDNPHGWHVEKAESTREEYGIYRRMDAMSDDIESMGGGLVVTRTKSPAIVPIYPHGVPEWVETT
jgi:hypothetical protein